MGELPVLTFGLFDEFLVFSVSAELLLVFLEADLVCKVDDGVFVGVVDGVPEACCFNLHVGAEGLVAQV